jgi:hypothetical protein
MCRRILAGAAVLLMAVASAPAEAQTVAVSPHVGLYLPVGVRVDRFDEHGELSVRKRQLTALVAGARARALGDIFGAEVSLGYSPSWVAVSRDNRTIDIDSGVLLASLRGIARLTGEVGPGRWGFEVVGGGGLIYRGGAGWDHRDPRLTAGLVVGGNGTLGVSGVPIALRLGLENYMTSVANGSDHPRPFAQRIHHNLVWSFGITLPVGE